MSAAEALAPERSVDEVRESLSVTEKGQPANTIGNCRTVFCHDPLLRGAIRLNLLTDRVDIVQDLGWRRNTSALTDTDVKYLLLYFEQTYGLTSEKKMTAALSIVANENCYHPIQDVLNGLVWDGTPRIRSCLHHFLGADESDYVEEMLKHFLLGAIRRVFRPGSKYEEMLCLVGGQGAGKSSFFRLLAIRDEWFSDDLKKLDDDRVYLKLQGHWIIEMSEMLATSSAKSIEEIRSFISRQKETYRTPYEAQPKDRLRQCVFGGSSNTLDFLPLDRAGNRRFLPIMIYPENAEVHILEDEDASRAYLLQVWAEAMTIYRSGHYSMKFSKSIQRQLVEVQKDFMPEDTEAGQIQGFLEHYTGSMVCSKQLFKEALGHTYDEPKRWQLHNINEIMNTVVTGWKPFSNPRMFTGYGRQRGWERDVSGNELPGNEDGFVELTEEECCQLELPKEWIAEAVAAAQYQRDHEHGGDGLETILQSPDVHRIWQAEGLGTGRFRQRTARQRRWICGADRGRMLPAGTAEGVDRIKLAVCCRDGCHLVAGFVAGDSPVWIRKKPVNKVFSNIYLYLRQRKQRDFSRKLIK